MLHFSNTNLYYPNKTKIVHPYIENCLLLFCFTVKFTEYSDDSHSSGHKKGKTEIFNNVKADT